MSSFFSVRKTHGNRINRYDDGRAEIEVIQRDGQKHFFLFDGTQQNLNLVKRYRWFVHEGYCCTVDEREKMLNLTWLLFGRPPEGFIWHHLKDRWDNRRLSLNLVTFGMNNYAKGVQKNRTTGIRGISKYKSGGYVALVGPSCKRKWFGRIEDAIAARKEFEKEMNEAILYSPNPDNGPYCRPISAKTV
jgi:hypothetical protein